MDKEKGKFCREIFAWQPWCAASRTLKHQFLDFIGKCKAQQVWRSSWSCGVGRVCPTEIPLTQQLASTGVEAGLPSAGRAQANVSGQGEGNSVRVDTSALLQCACVQAVLQRVPVQFL